MIFDHLTGEHALAGTTRFERPNEFRDGPEGRCAFCPGNEDLTPPEIARIPEDGGGWFARAFENKYPAIEPPLGVHEVIVDSPSHEGEITRAGLTLWRERYEASLARAPGAYPVIFKNSGAYAGATIRHPHTQMIAVPQRPDRWQAIYERGRAYQQTHGRCAVCDENEASRTNGSLVAEDEDTIARVRPSGRFAWSLAIVPLACEPSLHQVPLYDWFAVGEHAARAAAALLTALPSPAFNLLVYSDPRAARGEVHWQMELVPRVATLAGFELSTGMFIRSATAQESADRWRRMIAPPHGSI